MRDEDDSDKQEAVHTVVLNLLPPGLHDLLSHAGQKNLGMLERQMYIQCFVFCIVMFMFISLEVYLAHQI